MSSRGLRVDHAKFSNCLVSIHMPVYLETDPNIPAQELEHAGARLDRNLKKWYFPGSRRELPPSLHRFLPNTPRKLVLDIPFNYMPFARTAGALWDKQNQVVYYNAPSPNAPLPLPLTGFEPQPLSWEHKIQRRFDNIPFPLLKPTKNIVLRKHQLVAVNEIALAHKQNSPGFLLADEVGLGKTISTWASILELTRKTDTAWRILVVSPIAVIENWRKTVLWCGTNSSIEEVLILNYDRLNRLFTTNAATKPGVKALARQAKVSTIFDLIVFDESHRLKNLTAARTRLALKLYPTTQFIVWLSATAGQNPLELAYTGPILAARTGDTVTDLKTFEAWCTKHMPGVRRATYSRWQWQENSEDVEKINKLLFQPGKNGSRVALRRTPEQIEGWPPINRIIHTIRFSSQEKQRYLLLWDQFKQAATTAQALPKAQKETKTREAVIRLRQKASLLKVPYTVELAQLLIDNHHQVAISCEYLATMDILEQQLSGIPIARIDGTRTPTSQDKEAQRLRYQRGDAAICLFNLTEGISLHQGETNNGGNNIPRSQIDHDLRWSAIQQHQSDGRSHRDGKFAQVYWIVATDSIDKRVAQILLNKLEKMAQIQGDPAKDFNDILQQILQF